MDKERLKYAMRGYNFLRATDYAEYEHQKHKDKLFL